MTAGQPVYVDVTNTLAAPSTTGIQRVTIELVRRRRVALSNGFELVPITCDAMGWRRLTDDELRRLSSGGAPRSPSFLRRTLAGTRLAGVLSSLRSRVPHRRRRDPGAAEPAVPGHLRSPVLEAGSVFFDSDAAWHVDPRRAELLPLLRDRGVQTVMMGYDALPFERPDWFVPAVRDKFRDHVAAHLGAGSLIICISQDSRDRLERVGRKLGSAPVEADVVSLGSDGLAPERDAELPSVVAERYVLCVGTIEPRKNHGLLLDAWERMLDRDPRVAAEVADGSVELLVVGRLGWRSDALARRLRRLHRSDRGVRWLSSVNDAQLALLYRRATVVAMPSLDEGLGLPVLEARRHAVAVVASTGGGLPEALGRGGLLCDPTDVEAWSSTLSLLLTDEVERQMLVHASASDPPPTWDDAARQVWSLMRNHLRPI